MKNMDPEKHGINMGLKNISALREFNKENATFCDFLTQSPEFIFAN